MDYDCIMFNHTGYFLVEQMSRGFGNRFEADV